VPSFTYQQHDVEIILLDLGDAWSIHVRIRNASGALVKDVSFEREVKFGTREIAERQAVSWARRWIDRARGGPSQPRA
jgi:hypothetical protein